MKSEDLTEQFGVFLLTIGMNYAHRETDYPSEIVSWSYMVKKDLIGGHHEQN